MVGKQMQADSREALRGLERALEQKRLEIQRSVCSWSASNHPHYAWRQVGRTPYEVLIGEVWLREASPGLASRVYAPFLERFRSLQVLAEAAEDDLLEVLSQFDLEHCARRVKLLAQAIAKEGNGQIPKDSWLLARASGLQHHSIRIILCFGYGLPVAVVDSNIERMLTRLFSSTLPSRPVQGLLHAIAEGLLPYTDAQHYNAGLLDLAELVCKREDPLCRQCPVGEPCDYAGSLR